MITDILLPTFTILAGAIFLDFLLNGGEATSACIKAFGTILHGHPKNVNSEHKSEQDTLRDKIDELKAEMDNLNDELVDAFDEEERKQIEKKIERREKIIQMYLNKLIIKQD